MSHPENIFTEDNEVVPWDQATDDQKKEYLINIGFLKLIEKKKKPDKGYGKGNRKKGRGGRF